MNEKKPGRGDIRGSGFGFEVGNAGFPVSSGRVFRVVRVNSIDSGNDFPAKADHSSGFVYIGGAGFFVWMGPHRRDGSFCQFCRFGF